MIKVSVIGNHEKIKHYLGVWLKVFGFEVTDTAPNFTIEVLTSDSNVITHSNQSELAGLIRSLVYDFGIYEVVRDKRLAERADLSVSAYSDLCNIECAVLSKLIVQAVIKFYE
ncbi:MAG: hypothetical protein PUE13_07920 [Clostridiales bacterium]|nr:hypothetical protein [Clostridiales bacterium]